MTFRGCWTTRAPTGGGFFLLLSALFLCSCGGGSGVSLPASGVLPIGGSVPPPTISSVTVSCTPSSVQTLQTSQCSASVQGTGDFNSAVTWGVSPTGLGTVNANGFTASTSPGTAVITATSVQDPTKSASATVKITQPPPPTVSASASDGTITLGRSVTLTISTANATTCNISGAAAGPVSCNGPTSETPSMTGTATYTVTAMGLGGVSQASVSVAVTVLMNLSQPVGYNFVTAAGDFASGYVRSVTPGTPVTITTNSAISVIPGSAVTLGCAPPAPCGNTGTEVLLSLQNSPCCTYAYTDPGAVSWLDRTSYDRTYDAFSKLVVDNSGTIHNLYYEGYNHVGQYPPSQPPYTVCCGIARWRQSLDGGSTWTNPLTIFSDASTDCGGTFCEYRTGALGLAQNGNIIASAWRYNEQTGLSMGVYFSVYNGNTWSAPVILGDTPPDLSGWRVSFGQIQQFPGNLLALPVSSMSGRLYLVWSIDNGATWNTVKGPTQVTAAPNEECAFASAGGEQIIGFCRNDGGACIAPCGPLLFFVSTDLGATWTHQTTPFGPSVPTASYTMVAPWLQAGPNGTYTLFFGERDNPNDCGGPHYCAAIRAITFKPSDLIADVNNVSTPQVLWTGNFNDSTYPAAAATENGLLIQWYSQVYPSSPAKLYTQTASY